MSVSSQAATDKIVIGTEEVRKRLTLEAEAAGLEVAEPPVPPFALLGSLALGLAWLRRREPGLVPCACQMPKHWSFAEQDLTAASMMTTCTENQVNAKDTYLL